MPSGILRRSVGSRHPAERQVGMASSYDEIESLREVRDREVKRFTANPSEAGLSRISELDDQSFCIGAESGSTRGASVCGETQVGSAMDEFFRVQSFLRGR